MYVLISNISDISYLTGLIYNEGNQGGIFLLLKLLNEESDSTDNFIITESHLLISEMLFGQIENEFKLYPSILSQIDKSSLNFHKIDMRNKLPSLIEGIHNSDKSDLYVLEQNLLQIQSKLKNIKVNKDSKNIKNWIANKREYKNKEEIKALKKSSTISFEAYEHWLKLLKPGITELKAKLLLEELILTSQNNINKVIKSLAFPAIVAFGENTRFPHHSSSNYKKLKENDIILVDWGLRLNNYCSDHTRTFVYKGPTLPNIEEVENLHKQIINFVNKSDNENDYSEINSFCSSLLKKKSKLMTHGLGHGIGIEVHEPPHFNLKDSKIKKGQAITIEPGIYDKEFGIRYENTYIVNSKNQLVNTLDL